MKRSPRLLTVGLLLILPLLGSTPSLQPQAATIVTSLATVTTSITATSHSLSPLSTVVSTSTVSDTLISDDESIPPPQSIYCGYFYYYKRTLQQGQHLTGQLQANVSAAFFILGSDQYLSFKHDCTYSGGLYRTSGVSLHFDFVPPKDGDYYFIISNDSGNTIGYHLEVVSITAAAVTSTLFTTMAQTYATPWTQTMSSVYTQALAESPLGSGTWLILVAVLTAVALGAFFLLRTRQRTGGAKVELCGNCGSKLPRNAKFCKKCGKPTTKS